ncbi:MAG TPA: hypothetical protein PKY81_03730 [bacterium]|nr:hypothetical protein [bacterium]
MKKYFFLFLIILLYSNLGYAFEQKGIGLTVFKDLNGKIIINDEIEAEYFHFQEGDQIIQFDKKEVTTINYLQKLISECEIGNFYPITIIRNDKTYDTHIKVKIFELKNTFENFPDSFTNFDLGITYKIDTLTNYLNITGFYSDANKNFFQINDKVISIGNINIDINFISIHDLIKKYYLLTKDLTLPIPIKIFRNNKILEFNCYPIMTFLNGIYSNIDENNNINFFGNNVTDSNFEVSIGIDYYFCDKDKSVVINKVIVQANKNKLLPGDKIILIDSKKFDSLEDFKRLIKNFYLNNRILNQIPVQIPITIIRKNQKLEFNIIPVIKRCENKTTKTRK